MKNFRIALDLVKTESLSTNEIYYYKIKEPISINASAFACRCAFYRKTDGALVYYNANALLHELHSKEEIDIKYKQMMQKKTFDVLPKEYLLQFVWWSHQGNVCYFIEYEIFDKRQPLYTSIFLNLKEENCYRINEMSNNFVIINGLKLRDKEFDEHSIIKNLDKFGIEKHQIKKDKAPRQSILNKWLKRDMWYPY
ncbi:MAG: hypothetical protein QM541_05910 [Flavobacterium sp.]|nr:hypothetical protein [Flavobacterium sp.]